MDAIEALLTRRSVRRGFTDAPVAPDVVARIIECGKHAPSSKDDQPWRLHALTSRSMLIAIADRMSAAPGAADYVPVDPATGLPRAEFDSSVLESAEVLRSVPLVIAVEHAGTFSGGRERLSSAGASSQALIGFAFEYIGIGAAIENMWICAHAAGLVGVFIGDALIVEEFIVDQARLQGDLVGLLALGYSRALAHAPKQVR